MQLNRFIASSGICSRRKAELLIRAGAITINGVTVAQPGYRVQPTDVVVHAGKRLVYEPKTYILLNKPNGYITSASDDKQRRTVMDLVSEVCSRVRIFPVGRLDYETTGVLLLTNDGDLAQQLSHPRNEVRKVYRVTLDRAFAPEHYRAMRRGITLEDGRIAADRLEMRTPHVIDIALHSGRNRIVRRMFEFFGYRINALERISYGMLTLKGLSRGVWRHVPVADIKKLKAVK